MCSRGARVIMPLNREDTDKRTLTKDNLTVVVGHSDTLYTCTATLKDDTGAVSKADV